MSAKRVIEQCRKLIRVRRVVQKHRGKHGTIKYSYWQVDYTEGRQRQRRKFSTKPEADAYADVLARQRADSGAVMDFTPAALRDAWAALNLIAESGAGRLASLEHAVEVALKYQPKDPAGGDRPLREAVAEYVGQAERDGLRPRSVASIRGRLARFCDALPGATVSESAKEADNWLRTLRRPSGKEVAARTLTHYRVILHGLFGWMQDRGWIVENPAEAPKSRRGRQRLEDQTAPGILAPAQAERLMRAAERDFAELVPAVAVQLFCGLRSAEMERLDWSALNFEAGVLTVGGGVAKRRSMRVVDLLPAAVAWLAPHRREGGPILPAGVKWIEAFRNLRRRAGLLTAYPFNGLRHSFGTYHLAAGANANATALQLGHRDVRLLFAHYKGLATPADAAAFWAIRPAGPAKVVRIGGAAS